MQTIGERLEEARKRKGISIREAAEATKIRGDYLHRFEGNHFDINLPDIYVRGFLRTYAGYLKLPADKIVSDYNALGIGAAKPRSLSRELYGRMDLSVASNKEASEPPSETAPPAEGESESTARNPATFVPRAVRPQLDRDLIVKGAGLLAGAVILVSLIIWGIAAFANRDSASGSTPAATVQPAPEERMITLVALNPVTVTVSRKNADDSVGEELFRGTLARGESRVVPWPGPIYISANFGENLEIEYRGQRYPTQFRGAGRAQM